MPLTYEPSLVVLSLALAIQGSYVALRIASQIKGSLGQARRVLLTGAAFSLAVAIWGMHFVGMLAARLPMPVNYLVLPTLLSFLVCVLVVGVALEIANVRPQRYFTLIAAPIVMGGGIVAMHYIGMSALHESVHVSHDPAIVAISVSISIVASAAALWLSFGNARRPPLFIAALLLGLAISGMHYTAMVGASFSPLASPAPSGSLAATPALLAIVVALVAFALSGVFLLTFVPEQPGEASKSMEATYGQAAPLRSDAVRWSGTAAEAPAGKAPQGSLKTKRKIAAIMAADVAFYARLVSENEEETLRLLATYREVFDDFVDRYGGRVFNTAGDSVMSEFGSAVEAMRAALDIQESLRTHNLARPPERWLQFRIGITIADVVERQGELLGDGVNLAARLESLAAPGGICISRAVYEAVANKVAVLFRDLGEQTVKNIPTPVHVFIVDWPKQQPAAKA